MSAYEDKGDGGLDPDDCECTARRPLGWHGFNLDCYEPPPDPFAALRTPDAEHQVAQTLAQIVNDEGGKPGHSLHSWRCEYPDRFRICTCVADLADDLAKAALAVLLGPPPA